MQFGLTNAPVTFQTTLDVLFARFQWASCLAYLNYFIVFSNNLDEHVEHVREIMAKLHDSKISLKLKNVKSSLTQSSTWEKASVPDG